MRKYICIVMTCLMTFCISGCKTTNTAAERSPLLLPDRAHAITAAGGLATAGVARSKQLSSALDRSLLDAQTRLVILVTAKLDTLKTNLKDEVGEDSINQFNELFYTANDSLLKELTDIIPTDIKYETINGITTAYSLLIVDPNVVLKAFPSDSKHLNHIYTRFRASRAFAQMKKDLKQYEIWEKGPGTLLIK